MSERSIIVTLKAKVDDFKRGMTEAKKSVDDLTKADVNKQSAAFQGLATKAALAGAGIALGIGLAVKSFASFDKEMSAAAAATDTTGSALDALRSAAIKAGKDTQFSATEAAIGVTELGKAGVSAADILGGGLSGALDLAAAGQLSVGAAAETAASAMTQFSLKGSDVPHIADLLAAGASKAQGLVQDLGAALNQTGLVASQVGLSIEETTGGLAAFASAGLIGSDAGTSFKTMLQRLVAPSAEAKTLMGELGINAFDANGKFVGLATVAGQLQSALGGMSAEQRNAALATIFGSDAVRAAGVLYTQGQSGIQGWIDKVNQQGAASETAAKLMDNLAGDVEQLTGSIETAFIQVGSGGNDALRAIAQGATGVVNALGEIPGPVLLAGTALAALALAGPKAFLSFRQYKSDLDAAGLSLDKISERAPRLGQGLHAAATAAKIFGVALVGASVASRAFDDNVAGLGIEQLVRDLLGTSDAVGVLNRTFAVSEGSTGVYKSQVTDLGSALHFALDPSFIDSADNALRGLFTVFGGESSADIKVSSDRLKDLDTTLAQLVSGGHGSEAANVMAQIQQEAQKQGVSVDQLKAKFPQYAEALAAATNSAGPAQEATGALAQAQEKAAQSAQDAAKANQDLVTSLSAYPSLVLGARDAARGYEEAVAAASKAVAENGQTLDITTEKGRANQTALDGIASATLGLITHTFEARDANTTLADAVGIATGQVQSGRAAFIDHATQMGLDEGAAAALADQLGLTTGNVGQLSQTIEAVPDTSNTEVTVDTTAANAAVDMAQRRLDALDAFEATPVINANPAPLNTQVEGANRKLAALDAQNPTPTVSANPAPANTALSGVQAFLGRIDAYNATPVVSAQDNASGTLSGIRSLLGGIQSKDVTVTTHFREDGVRHADGAIYGDGGVRAMAAGGFVRPAMISSTPILWGEAGPEAYIPIDSRPRSRELLAETNRRMGNPLGVGGYSNVMVQQQYAAPAPQVDVYVQAIPDGDYVRQQAVAVTMQAARADRAATRARAR